jgi:uncharacterized protein (TIRG00374 family)
MAASEKQMSYFCRRSPALFALLLVVSASGWVVLVLEYGVMLLFLGASLSPIQTIAALTAVRLAYLLPLPGGLGTLETSQMLALSLMGVEPAIGVGASLLIRLRDVTLGVGGLWWGSRFIRAR